MVPIPDDGKTFDVLFDMTVASGVAHQRVHFVIDPAQPLIFRYPQAAQGNSIDMSLELVLPAGAEFADAPPFTMSVSGEFKPVAVPEPSVFAELLVALAGFGLLIYRRPRGAAGSLPEREPKLNSLTVLL